VSNDATVTTVDHSGVDPDVAAARHARQQADVLLDDLKRQEVRVKRQLEQLKAVLVGSRAAWKLADAEATRLEAIVREN
jgi:hypothetical protein